MRAMRAVRAMRAIRAIRAMRAKRAKRPAAILPPYEFPSLLQKKKLVGILSLLAIRVKIF
jgi:hypothetical protein